MDNFDAYYTEVVDKVNDALLLQEWPVCHREVFQDERDISLRQDMDIIFNSCIAAGGDVKNVVPIAAACLAFDKATHLIDRVQDGVTSANVRTETENIAFALTLAAYNFLGGVRSKYVHQVLQVFSASGFKAFLGQNHGFQLTENMPLPMAFELYWNSTILKSGSLLKMFTEGSAAAVTHDQRTISALRNYGMALGTTLQILDDCRDVLDHQGVYEISLPILLYSSAVKSQTVVFPQASSRDVLLEIFDETGTLQAISNVLLNWLERGLSSLAELAPSASVDKLKFTLERFGKENFRLETT